MSTIFSYKTIKPYNPTFPHPVLVLFPRRLPWPIVAINAEWRSLRERIFLKVRRRGVSDRNYQMSASSKVVLLLLTSSTRSFHNNNNNNIWRRSGVLHLCLCNCENLCGKGTTGMSLKKLSETGRGNHHASSPSPPWTLGKVVVYTKA